MAFTLGYQLILPFADPLKLSIPLVYPTIKVHPLVDVEEPIVLPSRIITTPEAIAMKTIVLLEPMLRILFMAQTIETYNDKESLYVADGNALSIQHFTLNNVTESNQAISISTESNAKSSHSSMVCHSFNAISQRPNMFPPKQE
ncbi:hypothetical protein E3N88_09384 [Mikania micrantha]|uniref:Uncharacterized protein n=1 Tax=Mikania micrantha TaxID=192012 RepID=A0A5N6PJT4_9ASTR|nr:hypothetical protein E3N88_09384 [Mikania micrantha]